MTLMMALENGRDAMTDMVTAQEEIFGWMDWLNWNRFTL